MVRSRPGTTATACARCVATPASRTTAQISARCSSSARRSSSTASARTSRSEGLQHSVGCAIAPVTSRSSPRSRRCRTKFVGALRLPDDETGDCFKFTQIFRRSPRRRARRSASACASTASSATARGSPACAPARAPSPATRTGRAGQLLRHCWCRRSASRCRCTRSRAIRSPCRSPIPWRGGMDDHRRDAQGRGRAGCGSQRPHQRDRGTRRLRPDAARVRDGRRWSTSSPTSSLGRRRRARGVLDRPAPDDAGRHAVVGPTRSRTCSFPRPRHAGVDNGRRQRSGHRRRDSGGPEIDLDGLTLARYG